MSDERTPTRIVHSLLGRTVTGVGTASDEALDVAWLSLSLDDGRNVEIEAEHLRITERGIGRN